MFQDDYIEIEDSSPLCRYRIKRTLHQELDKITVVEVEKCKLLITTHALIKLTPEQVKGLFVRFYQRNQL